jgi:hypothetical protein
MSVKPWDMLNPNEPRASEELFKERWEICKFCPELISLTSQCKKCGCVMNWKAKLERAKCPIGKW